MLMEFHTKLLFFCKIMENNTCVLIDIVYFIEMHIFEFGLIYFGLVFRQYIILVFHFINNVFSLKLSYCFQIWFWNGYFPFLHHFMNCLQPFGSLLLILLSTIYNEIIEGLIVADQSQKLLSSIIFGLTLKRNYWKNAR